jgi:hypothetical protein
MSRNYQSNIVIRRTESESAVPQHRTNAPFSDVPQHAAADQVQDFSDQFCILVAASDRAKDIFEVSFQNADVIWRDCNWKRYVGFTSQHPDILGFEALSAKADSDWRGRLGDYLDSLPDNFKFVMLIVEDFLFTKPISGAQLNALAEEIARNNLAYVKLTPVLRNVPGRLVESLRRTISKEPFRPLSFSEPYYSSLETTIWRRGYLRSLLCQPGTVWEFEHTVSSERHYAVWNPVVEYVGLVAREKWNREAPWLLARQGLSLGDSRRERQNIKFELRRIREKIVFQIFGFLSFRVRRRLNKISRN